MLHLSALLVFGFLISIGYSLSHGTGLGDGQDLRDRDPKKGSNNSNSMGEKGSLVKFRDEKVSVQLKSKNSTSATRAHMDYKTSSTSSLRDGYLVSKLGAESSPPSIWRRQEKLDDMAGARLSSQA
jgi:hypothetical protein